MYWSVALQSTGHYKFGNLVLVGRQVQARQAPAAFAAECQTVAADVAYSVDVVTVLGHFVEVVCVTLLQCRFAFAVLANSNPMVFARD